MPMLVVELEALPYMAGEEKAEVEAPPSKAVNSSRSRSERGCEPCGPARCVGEEKELP